MNIDSAPNAPTKLSGIVERITFHNSENGWTVLKVAPFNSPGQLVTVILFQAKVFAGSTMDFWGHWVKHPKFGDQFKVTEFLEKKPASSAALEKYLGSGLIKGVGPTMASRIVKHFKDQTLKVFEENIDALTRVPGIAKKKLIDIKSSWNQHKAIRDVMIFLQEYGLSTLYAVKIYKFYGDKSIAIVMENPYQLARDIYGIGFFSADKIALKLGFKKDGLFRIESGIRHLLAASREEGHCYLTESQIVERCQKLLDWEEPNSQPILDGLAHLKSSDQIRTRDLGELGLAYYSNTLYFDETFLAFTLRKRADATLPPNDQKVENWMKTLSSQNGYSLSREQSEAVIGISKRYLSVLTGGPGCGKTTTTKTLVQLLKAMGRRIILAAPTGRAAQRMTEVIGEEARTLHRWLEWNPVGNRFKKNADDQLDTDFLIVDECSMLDVNLAASLFRATALKTQVLMIGDPDQLPSVGAGQVLRDILASQRVAVFKLEKVFRQAQDSQIISYAHEINAGRVPKIRSPIHQPHIWISGSDCLFVDSEEATQDQLRFLSQARSAIEFTLRTGESQKVKSADEIIGVIQKSNEQRGVDHLLIQECKDLDHLSESEFVVPEKFKNVDLQRISRATGPLEELMSVLGKIHPWSSLHLGKTAVEMIVHLYTKSLPKRLGKGSEIQVLCPQLRGSLGTNNLNQVLQEAVNPPSPERAQISYGDKILRVGDRVIQTRNNYDLGVFNGDIGKIIEINLEKMQARIQFGKDHLVNYDREDLIEISLAYAITVHKSQGSEFDSVIFPIASQHFRMLYRNLIYTGLTRAKRSCVFVGSRKAFFMSVQQIDSRKRQTALAQLLRA